MFVDSNRNCSYIITPQDSSKGLSLTFDFISLDYDRKCYDYIELGICKFYLDLYFCVIQQNSIELRICSMCKFQFKILKDTCPIFFIKKYGTDVFKMTPLCECLIYSKQTCGHATRLFISMLTEIFKM